MPFGIPRLYAMIGAGVVVALFLAWVWRIDSLRARHLEETAACQANFERFKADVASKTELARLRDAENKARVEAQQEKIRSENDAEIRQRIAAARADRVRTATAKAHPGGGGIPSVPGTANAPLHPVGEGAEAQLHVADDLICIDNTIKAESWQSWWKEVSAIER
jgi:hypothetical protein